VASNRDSEHHQAGEWAFDGDLTGLIRRFKRWIRPYNALRDFGWCRGVGRPGDRVLEAFRNDPKLMRCDEYFRGRGPTYRQLEDHLCRRADATLFITNGAKQDSLLMLAEIDDKAGTGQADKAADYFRNEYLANEGVIEPSIEGRGRDIFFLVDVSYRRRADVREAMTRYAEVIRSEGAWTGFGVTVDTVFRGLPTEWTRDYEDSWRIKTRGCAMRLPYLCGFDLRPFEKLRPLNLGWIEERARLRGVQEVSAA
jgi:hypothetical protein